MGGGSLGTLYHLEIYKYQMCSSELTKIWGTRIQKPEKEQPPGGGVVGRENDMVCSLGREKLAGVLR